MLYLKGRIVAIDAMGTQTEILATIREKEAGYLLPVKANQPTLEHEVKECSVEAKQSRELYPKESPHQAAQSRHE